MALQDNRDPKLKAYKSYSATILTGVSDVLENLKGSGDIYISVTGGSVLVEAKNGDDTAYTNEGSVSGITSILTSPHISELKLTATGNSYVTVSVQRTPRGSL